MDETLWYKFTQHSDLKRMLLSTGNAELIEVCSYSFSKLWILSDNNVGFR